MRGQVYSVYLFLNDPLNATPLEVVECLYEGQFYSVYLYLNDPLDAAQLEVDE
jgi:hypothetical protein